jgi:hypothetical protein
LKGDGRKTPDFLARNAGHAFYLEATSIELPKDQRAENSLRSAVLDAIQRRVRSSHYILAIEAERETNEQPPTRQLCQELNDWLVSLDPKNYCAGIDPSRYVHEIPSRTFRFGGWVWTFLAFDAGVGLGSPPPRSVIGMFPSQGGVVTDHIDLAIALNSKASLYGELEHPLLIAVMNPRMLADDTRELSRALFGLLDSRPHLICDKSWESTSIGDFSPLWAGRNGPRNQKIAGVLYLGKLDIYHVPTLTMQGWECPWPELGIPSDLVLNRTAFDYSQCAFVTTPPSESPTSLFGLAPGWPNADPWPDPS